MNGYIPSLWDVTFRRNPDTAVGSGQRRWCHCGGLGWLTCCCFMPCVNAPFVQCFEKVDFQRALGQLFLQRVNWLCRSIQWRQIWYVSQAFQAAPHAGLLNPLETQVRLRVSQAYSWSEKFHRLAECRGINLDSKYALVYFPRAPDSPDGEEGRGVLTRRFTPLVSYFNDPVLCQRPS